MRRTIRRVAAFGAALAIIAPMTATAPATAAAGFTASESGYLAHQRPIERAGFWGNAQITDSQIVSIGYGICELLSRGLSDQQVMREMLPVVDRPGRGMTVGLERIRQANRMICPQY